MKTPKRSGKSHTTPSTKTSSTKLNKRKPINPYKRKPCNLTHQQVAAWQLLSLGYTAGVVAQMMDVDRTTVEAWKRKIRVEMAEMPTVRAAIDRTMTMVPKALAVADKAMDGIDIHLPGYRAVAYAAAKDVLTANRIFTDRMVVSDDRNKPDSDLVAEAERIMAQAKQRLTGQLDAIRDEDDSDSDE